MIDVQEKKNKIISFLKISGPSLPVRIAKAIEMDPVFASAISSELLGTKQIKTSHMKIGSSPLYLLPGQEQRLEEHVENLKSIENEAYQKLRENKILKDEDEEPAIRVALRSIKDFATPFKFQEKIIWRYTFTPKDEIQKLLTLKKNNLSAKRSTSEAIYQRSDLPVENDLVVKDDPKKSKKIESIFEEKPKAKKKSFLEQIEEFLEKKNTKIISIEEVDKKKVVAKTESENQRALLFAFNKKRISEDELMKCYKQSKTANLPYHIIVLGDLTKKMNDTIDAYKKLLRIDKLNTLPAKAS